MFITLFTFLAVLVDPLTAPFEFGVPIAAALVCVGLYIWSQLQLSGFKRTMEEHAKADASDFASLHTTQTSILNQQVSTLSGLRDVADGIKSVATAIGQQAINERDQMQLLREQSADIKVLAATQARIQDGMQKLLEQTIAVLARDREE